MSGQTIIEARGITKVFPGVRALDKVDFELKAGETHILLGENGAGKSTLMKVLSGAYAPDEGEVFISGQKVKTFNPRAAMRMGVNIIYQEFNLIPYMDVAQNIFLGRFKTKGGLLDRKAMQAEAAALLDGLNMKIDPRALVVDLSTAEQQMVEIAKALSIQSTALIMDEPTSALSERETEQLFRTIHQLNEKGIGIVYISHRLQELDQVGDRVTVLRDGKLVGVRNVKEVGVDELVSMMVGHSVDEVFQRKRQEPGAECLRVEGLNKGKRLQDVNLKLHAGEIVGLAGLVGSGRTDLARAVFGVDKYESGRVFLFGKEVRDFSVSDMVAKGVSLIPEDRKAQGLALILSVAENIVISSLAQLFPRLAVSRKRENEVVMQYIEKLRIATPSPARLAQFLSGGNQQKVVVAKWLCTKAKIFIFDEPTRGIDVGAKAEIYALMEALVTQGAAILMISSELPEVIGMSDRIYVMREGRVAAEIPHSEATQEKVIEYAMGADEAKRHKQKKSAAREN